MFYKSLLSAIIFTISTGISANTVVTADTINVDGYIEEKTATDSELETIKKEIQKQKQDIVLNKQKAKEFKELSKSTSQLSETTEEYLEERNAAKAEIAAYNEKVKCLQEEYPGKECDKYLKRKK
jgi:septal ring factor EnvC (AmiA/AmiB activator)